MTFELKAGDKVEIINKGIFHRTMVNVGDIATYNGNSFSCPTWGDTQICSKDFWSKYLKPYVASKPKTPFEQEGSVNSYRLKDLVLWNEGWFDWNGVGTPVIKANVCELKFRDGTVEIDGDFTVSSWRWEHYNARDIVAYRLHVPSVASQEAIVECLEDNPSVGIDLAKEGSEKTVEALVSITQEVKYTIVIKGTTFTFTQEELDALTEELLGFTTL